MKSAARASLSRLIEERGTDGAVLVPKTLGEGDGSDRGRNPVPGDPRPPTGPFYEAFGLPHAPGLWPEYGVVCVSDAEEGEECGEGLPSATRAGWVDEWMRRHSYETGHAHFRRTVLDHATLESSAEFAVGVILGERPEPPPSGAGAEAVRDDRR